MKYKCFYRFVEVSSVQNAILRYRYLRIISGILHAITYFSGTIMEIDISLPR